ncbi:Glutathione S-transferase omega-1 [Mactra antiquata]
MPQPTQKAFTTGSEFPPLDQGVLRLYSMRMCPYAQRTRILLRHKNIEHETVNINLKEKPEWYLEKITPLGKVPAIQKDDLIVYDSSIVNDYIDATYPGEKLTPQDPLQLAKDRMFLEQMTQVVGPFYKIFLSGGQSMEAAPMVLSGLDVAEKELKTRNTPFFCGTKMGMLDVLLFPHLERASLLGKFSPVLALNQDRFPHFLAWIETMMNVPAVRETATPAEVLLKYIQMIKEKNVNYDEGLEE